MDNKLSTFERVKSSLIRILRTDYNNIKEDSSLKNDLGCDSLDIVEFAFVMSNEFPDIVDEEWTEFFKKTDKISDIVKFIESKQK